MHAIIDDTYKSRVLTPPRTRLTEWTKGSPAILLEGSGKFARTNPDARQCRWEFRCRLCPASRRNARVYHAYSTHPPHASCLHARRYRATRNASRARILTARYFITADQSAEATGPGAPNHRVRQQLIPGCAGGGNRGAVGASIYGRLEINFSPGIGRAIGKRRAVFPRAAQSPSTNRVMPPRAMSPFLVCNVLDSEASRKVKSFVRAR